MRRLRAHSAVERRFETLSGSDTLRILWQMHRHCSFNSVALWSPRESVESGEGNGYPNLQETALLQTHHDSHAMCLALPPPSNDRGGSSERKANDQRRLLHNGKADTQTLKAWKDKTCALE